MRLVKNIFLLLFFIPFLNQAQYITVNSNDSAEDLVKNVLINSPCANVSNISVNGWLNNGNIISIGYFSKNNSTFPFNDGIILSTGRAASAVGPNSSILSEGPTSWIGDQDLEYAIRESNTINATVLEFDFLPLANKVSFEYIFSSEQYLSNPGAHQCNYSDGFAFLLKEVGTGTYDNLAVVPGTNIPVKVTTVRGQTPNCPTANERFFGGFNDYEHPTNFNGQTVVLKAEATVTPNVLYHIKLVIADQGNNLYDSAIFLGGGSFKVEKDLGTYRLFATNNPMCANETLPLDATMPGNNTYQWYKDNRLINGATQPTYLVTDAGNYSVAITLNNTSCVATGSILVEYDTNPIATNTTLTQCDIDFDGLATFNLNDATPNIIGNATNIRATNFFLSRANADSSHQPIQNITAFPNTSPNQKIYARIENNYGCYSIAEIVLATSNTTIPPVFFEKCDEDSDQDGITAIDLQTEITPHINNSLPTGSTIVYYSSISDAQIDRSPLSNAYINSQAFNETIFAKIKDANGGCFAIVQTSITIHTFTPPGFETTQLFLCIGSTMDLEIPALYSGYSWSTGVQTPKITIASSGTYTVTVTDTNGCNATKTFQINPSDKAIIDHIEIQDFASPDNTVIIHASGPGDYLYSLDGVFFQESNLFTNIEAGEYTVVVKDKHQCGETSQTIFVLDYPKFFTPNGDGFNDTWQIKNLPSQALISIYNRYGKLLKQISESGTGWNGTYNQQPMPADDYWFVLQYNGIIIKNHFSLKR